MHLPRWAGLALLILWGCGDDGAPPPRDTGTPDDAGPGGDDGGGTDAGPRDDAPLGCDADEDCDDGSYCNGAERCADAICEAGAPVDCDDGISCTTDTCDDAAAACTNTAPDADADGFADAACLDAGGMPLGDDCDDADPDRHPGGAEVCDPEHDEDCDDATVGERDADADLAIDARCCNGTSCGDDCDDTQATVHPGSTEACDALDNDCDGTVDDGVLETFYRDADGDMFGISGETATGCTAPSGFASASGDCDDADAARNPGAPETCDMLDNDCDGLVDVGATTRPWYADTDRDGAGDPGTAAIDSCAPVPGRVANRDDCDDADPARHPGAPETCEGVDNDCDTTIDEGVLLTFRRDGDGDGFGNPAGPTAMACSPPSGFVADGTDCDDTAADRNPGAPEVCDDADNDCDVGIDEGVRLRFFRDLDGDGFGNPTGATAMGCTAPRGYVADATDCDDTMAGRNPGAPETCDGVDNDCDAILDEGVQLTFHRDADGDGFGSPAGPTMMACSPPAGYVADATDCDDTMAARNPGAPEACDGIDNDCDSIADEGVGSTFYRDADGDGYGASGTTVVSCSAPAGYSPLSTDCNDADRAIHPGATEACNAIDDDCDGATDESGMRAYPRDADADGYGSRTVTVPGTSCTVPPPGAVLDATDCNDAEAAVHPGAPETCDGRDQDCSLAVSPGGPDPAEDADGDLHSAPGAACTGGYPRDDCDDTRATVHPGASEVCDGRDSDCSSGGGAVTAEDADGDAHASLTAPCTGGPYPRNDCVDSNPDIHAGAVEICDRLDDDCSSGGGVEPAEDRDGDGHAATDAICTGGSLPRDDCNDSNGTIYPGIGETCDGLDNDCSSGGGTVAAEDADGDNRSPPGAACTGGFPRNDCVDSDSTIYSGAPELCDRRDNDCSSGGGVVVAEDADGDMHAPSAASCSGGPFPRDDCNDAVATTFGGAPELCNRVDDDCSTGGGAEAAEDADADGHAPIAALCVGGTLPRDDCNDAAATTYPGATELCNRIDDNCSSGGGTEAAEDLDADGRAAPAAACTGGPLPKNDCVDSNATIHPGATELCDRLDNDCSTGGGTVAAEDADMDAHAGTAAACAGGPYPKDDCVDSNATIHPGASELCDRLDNDCSSGGGTVTAEDADADAHTAPAAACTGGPLPKDDCNDTVATTYPGASELCNRVDDNCSTGGGVEPLEDFDSDGHAATAAACTAGALPRDDCDDRSPAAYPGAPLMTPRPLWPQNGQLTGSFRGSANGTLRPTFRWARRDNCSATYDVQIDDTCATPGFGACALPSPEVSATAVAAGTYRPAANLAVSMVAPVGRRYYWRVRACNGPTCSAWSTVRYFDAGRAPSDFNGDGWSDVVVGARLLDNPEAEEGGAFVYNGSATGVAATPSVSIDNPVDRSGAQFGNAASGVGDVNADGFADLVIGSWYHTVINSEGRAYVFHGGAGGISATPTLTLENPTMRFGGKFGWSVAGAGDVDADGYADVVIGARDQDRSGTSDPGWAFVYRGGVGGLPSMPSSSLENPAVQDFGAFGWCVGGAGDLNGDGHADVVVGAARQDAGASDEGNAFVYYGAPAGIAATPSVTLDHPTNRMSGYLGSSCGSAGDLDGDGYADLVVGSGSNDAFVYSGSAGGIGTLPNLTFNRSGAHGSAVSSAGDVDLDGYFDLAAGAPSASAPEVGEGNVMVYRGAAPYPSTTPWTTLDNPADQAGGSFGNAVGSAGDVNGDGFGDLVVAAVNQDAPAMDEGNAFVFHGSATGLAASPARILDSPINQVYAQFGESVGRGW